MRYPAGTAEVLRHQHRRFYCKSYRLLWLFQLSYWYGRLKIQDSFRFIDIVINTKVSVKKHNHVIMPVCRSHKVHHSSVITITVDVINVNKVLLTLWQRQVCSQGSFVKSGLLSCSSICQDSNCISCTKTTVWYRKSHSVDEIFRVKTCFSSIQFTACHGQLASRYFLRTLIYSVSCRLPALAVSAAVAPKQPHLFVLDTWPAAGVSATAAG